ncbi:response regulator [Arcticibacter tournemirensis]
MKLSFIVIDDSELDCFIAGKLIRHTGKSLNIKTYANAALALNDIRAHQASDDVTTVILLDILMPLMNGFDFLNEFETLPDELKKRYFIIAITSSLNKNDIESIRNYTSVKGVIDKPVNINVVSKILESNNLRWTKD